MPQAVKNPVFHFLLLLIFSVLLFLGLAAPTLISYQDSALREGDVAGQDILAPHAITYVSNVLTERQRDLAENLVAQVYTPADTSVARQQLERLRSALAYITSVRADNYAAREQKLQDLIALEDIQLRQDTMIDLLALSDARWQTVQQETIVVLEQVMRITIRQDRLDEAKRSVPSLVSLSLPEDLAGLVVDLVVPFVVPNSYYDEALTVEARQAARDAVEPVTRSYVTGETIVQRGQIITATIEEALGEFGLLQPGSRWQDLAGAAFLTVLIAGFFGIYIRRTPLIHDERSIAVFGALFLVFLFGARLIMPGHIVIPYIFPLMAYSLTTAALFGADFALLTMIPLAMAATYGLPNALDLTLYYIFTSIFGVFALRRAQRITSFFWAGGAIVISGVLIIIAFRLPDPATDWVGLSTLAGSAVINGVASASISVLLQFFLAQIIGLITPLQLIELSRPDNPLLQFILRNAPGTYQHSLQVANLAEQAAERINADPLLTRVGALYHDAGKALNPGFFIENQIPGNLNPHDDLDPTVSSSTIVQHITEGVKLARKYRLPKRIQDFILEHHGTLTTRYQYVRAVEAAGGDDSKVDPHGFQYPGPRPQSKETALVMLADGCEARVRAERPRGEDELRSLIREAVAGRLESGELNDTELTLRELDAVVESFTATLRGVYHPRIEYPKLESREQAEQPVQFEDINEDTKPIHTAEPADSQSNSASLA